MNRKVAIYARVSSEHEAQLSALDNQVQYYDDILENPIRITEIRSKIINGD